jgi:hypothetical protein
VRSGEIGGGCERVGRYRQGGDSTNVFFTAVRFDADGCGWA